LVTGDVTACGGCGAHGLLRPFFDMGRQPLAESSRASARYPLALVQCASCLLVQLSYIADQREVFPEDHPYTTGNSRVLREHYANLTRDLAGNLALGDLVVDIGANDGTLLGSYPGPPRRVAIEPTNQVRKCGPGITQYQEFFTAGLAAKIRGEHGPARVVTACNVLAHVPDVHDFLDGVVTLLADDGEFVTENHDLASITEGLQIDTIYHEHLRYYSVATLAGLLERHGLRVTSSQETPMHGGSFRVRARKQRGGLQHRAEGAAAALRGMLWKITVQEKEKVYGIGATTRATPLLHYAGVQKYVTCVCEVPGSEKIGQLMPGTQIPVVDEKRLIEDQPAYALMLSWHIAGDIMPKLRAAGYQGKFIVPLPSPGIAGA
jgi:hypothetical protein